MTNRDLKNRAYEILRKRLINCEYKPGTMLNEALLAQELGFSKTPIREALNRIEQEGFVKILPKKGIYVTQFSLSDVMQIFQVRIEVEPLALRMASPYLRREELLAFREKYMSEEPDVRQAFRLDTAMHLFIIEHCGNRFIIDMMHRVFSENTRVIISSKQNEVKLHDARKEHIEIIDLLLEQKIDEAATALSQHIQNCRQAAINFFCSAQPVPQETGAQYKLQLERLFADVGL